MDVLQAPVHTVSQRVARFLEQTGLLEADAENSYLNLEHLPTDSAAFCPG